jgi:hypothetical protein
MRRLYRLTFFAMALVASPSFQAEPPFLQPVSLRGSIYARDLTNAALFTFRRTARLEGASVIATREYLTPTGTPAATETVRYEHDQLKRFVLEELQIHARGSATFEKMADGKTIVAFEYETGEKRKKTAIERQSGVVLINDTLPYFITGHWDELMKGESFAFRYAVIPRLETIGFTIRKMAQETSQRTVVEVEMRVTSWLLQKLVDPIVFTLETKPPHHIVQYKGRTTPKIRHGRAWEDLDAVTIFDW